jgi:signal transduction histidine kinase
MEAREAGTERASTTAADGRREPRVTAPAPAEGARNRGDLLWLSVLGRVAARAAHEVKGALNGVSVNLEVVRSRAAKPDAPAAAVQRFAESASDQLEELIRMSDALLGLARPPREPLDVAATLARLVTLLAPATAAEGGSLALESVTGLEPAVTAAPGNAARAVLAAALLAAIERKGRARCTMDGARLAVGVACDDGAPVVLPAEMEAAALEAGIVVDGSTATLTMVFPRAAHGARAPQATHA